MKWGSHEFMHSDCHATWLSRSNKSIFGLAYLIGIHPSAGTAVLLDDFVVMFAIQEHLPSGSFYFIPTVPVLLLVYCGASAWEKDVTLAVSCPSSATRCRAVQRGVQPKPR